jgi:formiminotetrahydrofolate cyclodeaminase
MFKKDIKKQNELIAQMKSIWEDGHGDEMTDAYNKIVDILGGLDMYSANILVNLLWLQTAHKTYLGTVGRKEGGEIDG